MQIIAHRRNTIEQLRATPYEYGVEIDLRSSNGKIILNHEPFEDGVEIHEWLRHYKHKFVILNVKEEGIENSVKNIMDSNGIKDYFFLDLSFPALVRMVSSKEKRIAVRFSEYEPIQLAGAFKGDVEWVWVDCFTKMPLTKPTHDILSRYFKICLVSPEIQGHGPEMIAEFKKALKRFRIDAVCTKHPEMWKIK